MQVQTGYIFCFLVGGIAAGMDEYYDKPLPGRVEARETQQAEAKIMTVAAQITQKARREESNWEDVFGTASSIYNGYIQNAEYIGSLWASKGIELVSSAHKDLEGAWGWKATTTKTQDATKTSETSSACKYAGVDESAANLKGEKFGIVQTIIVAFTIFCYLV